MTTRKLSKLSLTAGAPRRHNPGGRHGPASPDNPAQWKRERAAALLDESATPTRPPTGTRAGRAMARTPHRGAHHVGHQAAKQRGRHQPQSLRVSSAVARADTNPLTRAGPASTPLDRTVGLRYPPAQPAAVPCRCWILGR